MKINRAGIEHIKASEGLRLTAYPDPATKSDPFTIGYGHTSAAGPPKVVPGMKISQAEAEAILVRDLATFEDAVMTLLTRVPNENQFAAMVSLAFNIGPGNFAKSSVLRRFNADDVNGAADAFALWNKAAGKVMKGLERRRLAERVLFLSDTRSATSQPRPDDPGVEAKTEPPPKAPPKPGAGLAKAIMAIIAAAMALLGAWMTGVIGK